MNVLKHSVAVLAVLGFTLAAPAAWADTRDATCEYYKEGHKKSEKSGACQIAQHQGSIDIGLPDKSSFSLTSHGDDYHYKDQRGDEVTRSTSGNTQTFDWKSEHRKIVVTVTPHNKHGKRDPVYLSDLVGTKAGSADRQLNTRGFKNTGDTRIFTTWWNEETNQCVLVVVNNQGQVEKIENLNQGKCR